MCPYGSGLSRELRVCEVQMRKWMGFNHSEPNQPSCRNPAVQEVFSLRVGVMGA